MARGTGRRLAALAGCAALAATLASPPSSASRPRLERAPVQTGRIRVNQQGYLPHEAKQAMLMAPRAVHRPERSS